VAFNAANILAD